MGTFTPLVFGTNGGMGLDCQNFLRTLANKLLSKNNEPYGSVISWLRIQLSFAIFGTVHRCVRGSRYLFKSREVSEDFTLLSLSPGQTIATCQHNMSQHCWAQHVACVWPPCCDMLGVVGSNLNSF